MSNNKTVVPGMGVNAYDPAQNTSNFYPQQTPQFQQPQQPQQPQYPKQPTANYAGTYFPGMEQVQQQAAQPGAQTVGVHKTVMGFLYSVSRTGNGEYWPLYMGLNTIGRGANCSVRLSEATISESHAELVIRMMKNPDSVLVSIQDARSTCGTMLNGSSLGFDAQEMHNGDVLTIGEHYDLYFILVDTRKLGLAPREDFIAVPESRPAAAQAPVYAQPQQAQYKTNSTQVAGAPSYGAPNVGGSSNSTIIMPAKK